MITVLMSTYNGEKYLKEQLDSILSQENVDLLIFIRDDGSNDSTLEILNEYKKRYANIEFYSGTNVGCAKSFYQLVLEAPKSEYYAFADQDDVWDTNKLYEAITKIRNIPAITPSLYFSTIRPVDKELNIIPYKKRDLLAPSFGIALTQAIAPGCSYVFNRKLLDEFKRLGIENVDIHDWSLFRVATALNAYVYYDSTPHFSYRQHENNLIGSQHSLLGHWIGRFKRIFSKDYQNIRSKMAKRIISVYYDSMDEENKKLIEVFANYDISINTKIQLMKTKNIGMVNKFDNIIFKLLILLGRL